MVIGTMDLFSHNDQFRFLVQCWQHTNYHLRAIMVKVGLELILKWTRFEFLSDITLEVWDFNFFP
jgi:hypothetical protein